MKKEHYVATDPIRKFKKDHHVTCSNKQICNKFGYQPTEECIKTNCPFADIKEIEVEVTPKGFARKLTMYNFVDF